jgi:hypothetical protein
LNWPTIRFAFLPWNLALVFDPNSYHTFECLIPSLK